MSTANLFRNAAAFMAVAFLCSLMLWPISILAQETNAAGTNAVQKPPSPPNESVKCSFLLTKDALNITYAFIVGSLGAGAFFFGIFCGFISRESRERLLEFLTKKDTGNAKAGLLFLFCVFGGIVAAVFQAAQASVFAPIQAFVLGATWPSVVTRIMSGNGQPTGLAALAADSSAGQIPTPKSSGAAKAADAQVVIKPKSP